LTGREYRQEIPVIRLYRFPLSANVERVTLALAHKKLPVESIAVDPRERSLVKQVSGQELVPVIEDEGRVVADSMEIIRYLDGKYPDPPLFPLDPARRAEMDIFIDWFNRVWKRPPNEIFTEMGKTSPDQARIERLGRAMAGALDLFEGMLSGRKFLMGAFSAADCAAFPFVKFALLREKDDPYLFHRILIDWQPVGEAHPRLADWIRRMNEFPRA
jgi:maleylpyruvate isomerase